MEIPATGLPSSDLWKNYHQQWSWLGAPLRPGREDIEFTRGAVADWLRITQRDALTFLVMGVTPELCRLPLDAASRLIAVDRSSGMIRGLWQPGIDGHREAVCGDWRSMPLADSSIDIVVGDGSLSFLSYPADYLTVFANLRRVLRPDGRCIIRCFTQIDPPETPEELFRSAREGRISGFHEFKLRLKMALQPDAHAGVGARDVWDALHLVWPELDHLAESCGWPLEQVLTVRAYRNADNRSSFPTRAEYGEAFEASGFSVVQALTPSYEFGERSPTLVLEISQGDKSR